MIIELLKNYLDDLKNIHSSNGYESVNFFSCGTPYFNNEEEFVAYILKIENAMEEVTNGL